jgi:hypothetical protein
VLIHAILLLLTLVEPGGKIAVIKDLEVTERKQTVEVIDFVIYQDADDGGTSTITGRVFGKNYNSTYTYLQGTGYAPNIDVYINYGTSSGYHDKVETDANGYYTFTHLRKGTYRIFMFSDVPLAPTTLVSESSPIGTIEISQSITITENKKEYMLPDATVNL